MRGPRGWLPADVAQIAAHLGWPVSVPSLEDLGLKLRLGVLSRLNEQQIVHHFRAACDCVWHPSAALLPFLAGWAQNGVLASLAAAVDEAESLGLTWVRSDMSFRLRRPFGKLVGTKAFNVQIARFLRKRREVALLPKLRCWQLALD